MTETEISLALGNRVQQIPLRLIDSPKLMLRDIDEQAVIDLTFSIKKHGILQPLQLRIKKDGRYEVVFGNHRHEAAKRLGLSTVPAMVRDVDEHNALLLALAENIQRVEMDPVKEGEIFMRLLDNDSSMASIVALSREVGKCADYIRVRIAVYQNLVPLLRKQINKTLTITNAIVLSKQPKDQQEEIYYKMQKTKVRLGKAKSCESLFVPELIDKNGRAITAYCVCPQCGTKHIKGIKGME